MGVLRFLLAISVVITHSSPIFGYNMVGGKIAVQAFYIISGFYMALILNEKYVKENGSYKLFITNRLLRLFPIYWSILFLTTASSIALFIISDGNDAGKFSIYTKHFDFMSFGSICLLLFSNLFIFLQDLVLFLGIDNLSGELFFTSNFRETSPQLNEFLIIPQAWTVGLELSFYLIAPFLARKKMRLIAPLILCSLLLRLSLHHFGLNIDPWPHRFFPTELVFFLMGIVCYKIYCKVRDIDFVISYLYAIWVILLGFTLLFSTFSFAYKQILYLILFSICLPFIFILTKNWKYDAYIGELSYPIYISHIFVFGCITTLNIPVICNLGLTLVLFTLIFSVLLNELISKKIEKFRQKRIATVVSKPICKTTINWIPKKISTY